MFEAAPHDTRDATPHCTHRPAHAKATREATPRDATADTPRTVWVSDGDTPRDRDGISTDYTRYGVYRTATRSRMRSLNGEGGILYSHCMRRFTSILLDPQVNPTQTHCMSGSTSVSLIPKAGLTRVDASLTAWLTPPSVQMGWKRKGVS